jgi:predicted lipoprotein with Yx(FWY)xxD motif
MLKLRTLLILSCLLLLLVLPAQAQEAPPTVSLGDTAGFGPVLVGPNGMTLYIFSPDPLDGSVCYERCAELWPPLIVFNPDSVTLGEGIPGELGVIERSTGTMQVTYNGQPLYYWFSDTAPGDTRGNGVGGVWWVVPPATVYADTDDALGNILVGPTGMTLYMFTNDQPGVSNCYDQCAENWPPLLVDSADAAVAGVNLVGELGTTERTDGTLQVTYNGWPLYYWHDDVARGDTTGEGVGDVWFTVAPEMLAVGNTAELGDFLVAASGRTLYQFAQDEPGVSNCTGDCAQNWPPLTVGANDRLVAAAGITGELGTIEREDGSLQVTYNGVPLYLFNRDRAPGDTNGQGAGDGNWSVVAP